MMRRLRGGLTYANVVATLCLFLLLGGGAYAAIRLPKSSVGTNQLKNGAVTGAKVRGGSLVYGDFASGQLPAGPQGIAGEKGPKGERGQRGAAGATSLIARYGPEVSLSTGGGETSYAKCKSGETVTGGGFEIIGGHPSGQDYYVVADRPSDEVVLKGTHYPPPENNTAPTGWAVEIQNESGSTFTFRSYAMCASP